MAKTNFKRLRFVLNLKPKFQRAARTVIDEVKFYFATSARGRDGSRKRPLNFISRYG
ncbi:hypothetical protein [uncultured Campylobacter sp.]|uniref:hypothetical protein n=1 Tax=uncultured Campylobacter sp. TaxID=218934 RepID=UPI0026271316|nr:hypothetical protein [uncultured Campylobacter sp.]